MKRRVSIIGGGISALMLAAHLDTDKFEVILYEKNKALGRKFLVAGKGGFNLTHSESINDFIDRYTPQLFLNAALQSFTNLDFRQWLDQIGIPTYVGSSNRVYPIKGIKPIEVLNKIMDLLVSKGVIVKYQQQFTGWDYHGQPTINNNLLETDILVLSLGGSSWKVTGSDGAWLDSFKDRGIATIDFQSSNCGYHIKWDPLFIKIYGGSPLKNISITCGATIQKGEAVITSYGIEGNAVYGLSPIIRAKFTEENSVLITIDFKPTLSLEELENKLVHSNHRTITDRLKKDVKLSTVMIALLRKKLSKEDFISSARLAKYIKNFPVMLNSPASLDESISTVGGVDLNAVDDFFMVKKIPQTYCIGEMLDWDAPTGGYLLQGCASMGVYLSKHLNQQ